MHPCRKSISLFTTTLLLSVTPSLLPNSVGATHAHRCQLNAETHTAKSLHVVHPHYVPLTLTSPNPQLRIKGEGEQEAPAPLSPGGRGVGGEGEICELKAFELKLTPMSPLHLASAQTLTTQNPQTEVDKLFQEGVQQYRQGYYPKALATYQRVLEIRQQQNNKAGIAQTLNNMGEVYNWLRQNDKALEVLQQALAIPRELKDKAGEGETLDNIGFAYYFKAQNDKALENLQQALAIRRELQDKAGEGKTLSNIGLIYGGLEQYPKALETLQQALAIHQQLGDKFLTGITLRRIGRVYESMKEYTRALEWYEKSLAVNREVQNRAGEGESLIAVGDAYYYLEKYDRFLEFYQQALPIIQEAQIRTLEASIFYWMGDTYSWQGNKDKAIEFQQQALAIRREIKDDPGQLSSLTSLYKIHGSKATSLVVRGLYPQAKTEYSRVIELAQEALTLARKLKNKESEADALYILRAIYSNQGNSQKALEFAQARLAVVQKAKLNLYEINSLVTLSQSYLWVGDSTKAVEIAQQALTLAQQRKSPSSEALALNVLSEAYKARGEYELGVKAAETSLEIARKNKDFLGEVAAAVNLSTMYEVLGEYQKVIAVAEPSLVQARKRNNRLQEAGLLIDLGNAYGIIGKYEQGKQLVEQGLTIARELKNRWLESYALVRLSSRYKDLGEYQKTWDSLQQSLKIAQEINIPAAQTLPLISLGIAYAELGDYQKSNESYQQALTILRQLKNRYDESLVLLLIAQNNFAQGNPQKTIEFAQQGLAIASEIKSPHIQAVANILLSFGYGELGNDQQAMAAAQSWLTFTRKVQNTLWEKSALNLVAVLHKKFGRKEQAIATYQQALAIKIDKQASVADSGTYAGLGQIYRDLNQPNVAITYYKQSINGLEEVRRRIQGLPQQLQNSFLQATFDFNNVKTADIYRQFADLLLSQGRDKEAQQVLELLKIQEIRDVARGGGATSDKPNVPLTATETKIPAASQSLIALGRQISECDRTNCSQKSALNDKLTAVVEQFNQDLLKIDKEIRANRTTDDVFFDPRKLAKAREIVKAQPGTMMIYPLVMENKLWLLMYSEGDVVKKIEVKVGQQELGETVVQFRKLLESPNSNIAEVQATSAKLYNWLIKPLEAELKVNPIKHLVFSLDRVTRYIPMSALFDGKNYLIENYSVYTVLSADLTDMRDRLPVGTQNTSVLAMGLSDAVPGFNPLPNVPAELDAIVRTKTNNTQGIYPGEEFLNRAFDFRTLRDNLTGYKILHLATHGEFVPNSSDKSYLLLGTGEQLTIAKINALTGLSNIHLVVLSACETALAGPRQDGVEIASVAYYFLNGGAKAVMASLWSVNDASTSLLMQQFYKNLATGTSEKPMTKAEAMRQSQLSLLQGKLTAKDAPQRGSLQAVSKPGVETTAANNSRSNFSHPYYWAPFILIGNGL